jgi:manganese efflux pump family protein
MQFAEIALLAFGLSMDAMAVAASRGVSLPRVRARHLALVAGFFGGFQALMPCLGWALGSRVGGYVEAWDHWLVLLVLGGIGAKMLWESRRAAGDDEAPPNVERAFDLRVLCLLAIATSIDAFAAGFTLPLVGAPLLLSVLTIGVTTALLSALGLLAGQRVGAAFAGKLEAFGGLVLIGLGVKTAIEHLSGPG